MDSKLLRICYSSLILLSILVSFSHQSINDYRLPNTSKPYRYQIEIIPHMTFAEFSFEGESKIFLEVFESTKNLTLNSFKLEFHEESTKLIGDEVFKPQRHILNEERQFLILNFHDGIEPGLYFLYLKYKGKMNNKPMGFFSDYYFTDDNEKKLLAATQFETTFARMAFPCWDEPSIKATFDISIKHFPNYTALSNMPLKKRTENADIDGKVWSIFETTPQISTYLISYTISDFQKISNSHGNFSVWSHNETLKYLSHSYEIGMKTFPILKEYTGIAYNLPKMDVIGLPGLSFGAMENWGLITVMEHHFLIYNHSTDMEKFTTSIIMVHEIAHQWFGNLVSPAWWEDVWITEGLATYMHYFILSKVMNYPRIMDYYVALEVMGVLSTDHEEDTTAIYRDINSPQDTIMHLATVHNKAATVMHIIRSLLSEEVFHSGIKKMLQKYKYGTITTNDFWSAMQEAMEESKMPHNNFDIKLYLGGYISQAGYPIINVVRDYTTGIIKLTQTSDKTHCKIFDCLTNFEKWWVPINLATTSFPNFTSTAATSWMDPNENELIIDGVEPQDWYIINIQSAGFYRVNYDTKNWNRIIKYMNSPEFKNIHVLNRAKLLDDAYFFVTNNKLDKSLMFNLTSYLIEEDDLLPWKRAERIFFYAWRSRAERSENKKFILRLVQSLVDKTGVTAKPDDDFFTRLKRNVGLSWICRLARRHCDEID